MADDSGDRHDAQPHRGAPAEDPVGFVRRWSRRKRAHARRAGTLSDPKPTADRLPRDDAPAVRLPDPALLSEDSDYSAFLGPRVEEALRRRALRHLFRMPKFNVRDGLDDYADDYRVFDAVAVTAGPAADRWAVPSVGSTGERTGEPDPPAAHRVSGPVAESVSECGQDDDADREDGAGVA